MKAVLIILALVWLAKRLMRGVDATPAPARMTIDAADVRVVDGDSVRIGDANLRISGYDAPEWDQPGGAEATRHLRSLVHGDMDVVVTGVDRHDRGLVTLGNAEGDVARQMVEAGHGVADEPRLEGAMATARRRGLGLWARRGIIDPAAWRRGER